MGVRAKSTTRSRRVECVLPYSLDVCALRLATVDSYQTTRQLAPSVIYAERFQLADVIKTDDDRIQFQVKGVIRKGKVVRSFCLSGSFQEESAQSTRVQAEVALPIQQIGCIAALCAPGIIMLGYMMLEGKDSRLQAMMIGSIVAVAGLLAFLAERSRYWAGVERCLDVLRKALGVHDSDGA